MQEYTRIDNHCKSRLNQIFIKPRHIDNINASIFKTDNFTTIVNVNFPNFCNKSNNTDKSRLKKYFNYEHLNSLIKV